MEPTEGEDGQPLQQALLLFTGSKSPGTSAKLCLDSTADVTQRDPTNHYPSAATLQRTVLLGSLALWSLFEGDLNGMLQDANDWDKKWAALLRCKCHSVMKTFNIRHIGWMNPCPSLRSMRHPYVVRWWLQHSPDTSSTTQSDSGSMTRWNKEGYPTASPQSAAFRRLNGNWKC